MLLHCTNLSCTNNLSLASANAPHRTAIFINIRCVRIGARRVCETENHCVQYVRQNGSLLLAACCHRCGCRRCCCCRRMLPVNIFPLHRAISSSRPAAPNTAPLRLPAAQKIQSRELHVRGVCHTYTVRRNDRHMRSTRHHIGITVAARALQLQLRSAAATRPYFVGSIIARAILPEPPHHPLRRTQRHATSRCAKVNIRKCPSNAQQRQSDFPQQPFASACVRKGD